MCSTALPLLIPFGSLNILRFGLRPQRSLNEEENELSVISNVASDTDSKNRKKSINFSSSRLQVFTEKCLDTATERLLPPGASPTDLYGFVNTAVESKLDYFYN